MEKAEKILCLLFLIIAAAQDLRNMRISMRLPAVCILAAFAMRMSVSCSAAAESMNIGYIQREFSEIIYSILPGGFLMILAYLRPEMLGKGDGFCLAAIGCCSEIYFVITVLAASLLMACGCSLILLGSKKKTKDSRIPFIPFLLAGYAAACCM